MLKQIAIATIERDMLLQPRATMHLDWIEDYAADMVNGAKFPPVIVFFDGTKHWLGDGFHRCNAAEAAGLADIAADVRKGSRRDALLMSVGANAQHGHRRTNEDKRRAVDIMLNDPEWEQWANREIARRCGVSEYLVRDRRDALSARKSQIAPRLVTRAGTTYEMQTTQIGAAAPSPIESAAPGDIEEAESPLPQATYDSFDWEASKLRNTAMEAIRALASLPEAETVIEAWMKSSSYGEPIERIERAHDWLAMFITIYRVAEPQRWARVQRMVQTEGVSNAAE